jgi:hypothetical protein
LGALLALLAAISYGIGDFLGGLGGRRAQAALIPIPVQVVGVLTATVAILTSWVAPRSAPSRGVAVL